MKTDRLQPIVAISSHEHAVAFADLFVYFGRNCFHLNMSSVVSSDSKLPMPLVERVMARLGFERNPAPDLNGLRAVYAAWCSSVPFDNVRKLIHLRTRNGEPLPGSTPEDFLEAWLKFGTGGTCWSGA